MFGNLMKFVYSWKNNLIERLLCESLNWNSVLERVEKLEQGRCIHSAGQVDKPSLTLDYVSWTESGH